jgi:fucose permease
MEGIQRNVERKPERRADNLKPRRENGKAVALLLNAGFFVSGVVATLLGPLLPLLATRWTLNDSQSGRLFVAQFLGTTLGVLASGSLKRHFGPWRVLATGYLLTGLAVALLVSWSYGLALVCASIYGIGLGATTPLTNLLIAERAPHGRAAALNLAEPLMGPRRSGLSVAAQDSWAGCRLRGVLAGIGAMAGAVAASIPFIGLEKDVKTSSEPVVANLCTLPHHSTLVVFGLLFFLYVGTEASVCGWIAAYGGRVDVVHAGRWLLAPSLFWGALLSRALAGTALRKLRDALLALGGLTMATGGILLLVTRPYAAILALALVLAGIGLGPVYPATIARLVDRCGQNAGRVAGTMFARAALGGAILPWLVGFISTQLHGLRVGLFVPLCGSLTMLVLYWSRRSQVSPEVSRAAGVARGSVLCRFNGTEPALLLVFPRIKQGYSCDHCIASHEGQIVMKRGGRQQSINDGQVDFARTGLRSKMSPTISDLPVNR